MSAYLQYAGYADRLWAKVDRSAGPDACWPFTGSHTKTGFGQLYTVVARREKFIRASTLAYVLTYGELEDFEFVDPICGNRSCCNPAHLETVLWSEHITRAKAPDNSGIRNNTCPAGHEWTAENTSYLNNGKRQCRSCANARSRRDWANISDEDRAKARAYTNTYRRARRLAARQERQGGGDEC